MLVRRRLRTALVFLVGVALVIGNQALPAHADTNVSVPFLVNFQSQTATTPAGYTADYGQAYDATRGYGWTTTTGVPLSLVGNGRERNVASDKRLDTFMQAQLATASPGVHTVGSWQAAVPNGAYSVTVAAGDPSYTDSHDVIRVEGVSALDFTPSGTTHNQANTLTVNVTNGFINLDVNGGTNTKVDYIDIRPASTANAHVTAVTPTNGATAVSTASAITVQLSNGVDPTTANAQALQLIAPDNTQVAGFYNTDGAYSNATFQPSAALAANTSYTVRTTASLKDPNGNSYDPFTSTFTTGTMGATTAPGVSFNRTVFATLNAPTAMELGPDGKLYVANGGGQLLRYTLAADGNPVGSPQSLGNFAGQQIITSIKFDPAATSTNLKLWVVHGNLCDGNSGADCPDFSDAISVLTGTNLEVQRDVITGLPRSIGNHMTNGIAFGPDGKLYIAQSANNGYGDPDPVWGNRSEDPLTAAVLVVDVESITGTLNVDTATGYDPSTGALKTFATGIRNPYTLLWDSNGKLYAPVNESANGNTPADPAGGAPALTDLPAYNDYFTQVVGGKYYGHPNPTRGEYRLNGANPTAGVDPFEVTQYPVGTQPNANWRKPDMNLGPHRSADGTTEFKSNVFGANLQGEILTTEYSNGKDVIAVKLDANGNPVSQTQVAAGFYNPLPIVSDPVSGNTYVGEYGRDPDGVGGQISLLTPNTTVAPPPDFSNGVHVNFQAQTTTTPTGYIGDYGQAYDSTRKYGWTNVTGTPTSLVGNGRERKVVSDKRLDTFMQMQLSPGGNGVATEGRWQADVPNGTYNVTVAVGDPSFLDSHDVIRAEGSTIADFTPVSGMNNKTVTAQVTVADGQLNIDAQGGTNTKIDYIDAVPATQTQPPPTAAHVNFQAQTSTTPTGYSADFGQAFDTTRGYGWETSTGAALSLVGNGRDRGTAVADTRLDTFMQMQLTSSSSGVHTPGQFEVVVPNGTYSVTVGVGDPSFTDSHDVIRAEGQPFLDFAPSVATPTNVVTLPVTVADGRLTLDAVGGTNTKIDYVDVVPSGTTPPVDTTPPVVTVTPSGTQDTNNAYIGSATVTINATDTGSGVKNVSYQVDGGAQQPYNAPFQVTGSGSHTVTAFAVDNANNQSANVTSTFTVATPTGPSAVQVTTPEDNLGLGSRLVFSTVKSESRTGHAFTIKNNGTGPLTVNSMSFAGVQGKDFQFATGTPATFTLQPGTSQAITVNYRPTGGGFGSGITYVSQASLIINSTDQVTPQYTVTLGGLNARDYESFFEPSSQDILNAAGYTDNTAVTNIPQGNSISPSSTAQGDEVLSAYWKRVDTTKPASLIPIAHYSGKSTAASISFGTFPKGGGYSGLYQFPAGTDNDGYGQNQLMLPTITGTNMNTSPTGSFGFGDGAGNRSDDNLNSGKWHNVRFWPAKNASGNVIPGSYLVGDDIGAPVGSAAKNWDYQDYMFLMTNVQPDGGNNQPTAGVISSTLDFSGTAGGIGNTGFTSTQGAVDTSKISFANGQLLLGSTDGSNTSRTNALQIGANAGDRFQVQGRLVGPFDAINAASDQQAIYFGTDATHYIKAEVEWNPTAKGRFISIWQENGSSGSVLATTPLPTGNASTVDLAIVGDPAQVDSTHAYPGKSALTISYALNGGSYTVLGSTVYGFDAVFQATAQAGLWVSNQGGGAPFTGSFDSFAVARHPNQNTVIPQ